MKLIFETTIRAPKEAIWNYYSDIEKWYIWEDDLEHITLSGVFQTGTTGSMKLKDTPALEFTLTKVCPNQCFVNATETPMGTLVFSHTIEERADHSVISHAVSLVSKSVTYATLEMLQQIFATVPKSVYRLKQVVEQ